LSIYSIQDSNALLLYKVGPVHVCSSATSVESVIVPPALSVLPGSNSSEPGIFKSIHGMVRVVDLRVRFGVDKSDFLDPGRIIVVNIEGARVGFHVDEIEDVAGFPENGWKDVPAQIPREVFSRTLLKENLIRLYADFEALDRFKATGYLRKHIEQLKKLDEKSVEKPCITEKDTEKQVLYEGPEGRWDKNRADEKITQLNSRDGNAVNPSFAGSTRPVSEKSLKPQTHKSSVIEKKVRNEERSVLPVQLHSGKIETEKLSSAVIYKPLKVGAPVANRGGSSVSKNREGAVGKPVTQLAEKEKIAAYTKIENRIQDDKKAVGTGAKCPDRKSINYRGNESGKNAVSYQESSSQTGLIWAVFIIPVLVIMVYFWNSRFDEKNGDEERPETVQNTVDLYDTEKMPDQTQESGELDLPEIKQVLSEQTDIEKEAPEQQVEQQVRSEAEGVTGGGKGVMAAEWVEATDEIESQEAVNVAVADDAGAVEVEKADITVAREAALKEVYLVKPPGYSPGEFGGEPGDVALIKNNSEIMIVVNELPEKALAEEQEKPGGEGEQMENSIEAGISSESVSIIKSQEDEDANIESSNVGEAREAEKTQVDKPVNEKQAVSNAPEASGNIKIRKYIHVIVKGDTLWDIAKRYVNNPWRYPELARLSSIKNPDLIYPGNKVIVIIQSQ